MNHKLIIISILILSFCFGGTTYGQKRKQAHRKRLNVENFFGIQFKPLIPFGLVGDKPMELISPNSTFTSIISPAFGYSYGGIVRIGLTELLAIETGLSYSRRNFKIEYDVPSANASGTDNVGFVSLNLPVNLLVYVKLGKQFYMNVGAGASMNYYPSNIRTYINFESPNTNIESSSDAFIFEGRRYNYVDFNANAEVGFEYRTEKAGSFYLGMGSNIPFKPILHIATEYRHDIHDPSLGNISFGNIKGATFAINVKYFFHNIKQKRGIQPDKGPIDY